jgi:2-dehydropantoate 2-reductase
VITSPADATPVDWVLITTKAYDAASAAAWLPALCRADTRVVVLQNGVEHVERFSPYVPVDWVLITTKAYDAASAARWLPSLCRPDTRVVVLQNGVEHVERFSPYVAVDSLVPAVIDCPAERTAPGRMRQRGASWIVVPETDNGRAFVPLWSKTNFDVKTDDFKTRAWAKLCINAPGAISAILMKPTGVIQVDPIPELTRGIVRECLAVGRAEGARLDDDIVDAVVEGARKAPPDSLNSLIADRMAGRPMEIDARNGAVVRFGRKHGIPTPLNEMAVALLVAAQDTRTY